MIEALLEEVEEEGTRRSQVLRRIAGRLESLRERWISPGLPQGQRGSRKATRFEGRSRGGVPYLEAQVVKEVPPKAPL